MRAVVHTSHGGPEVLETVELADPEPGPNDVVVAVRATGVNRLDVLQRRGPGVVRGFRLPHVAGMDIAGDVVAVGDQVTSVEVGDRVLVKPGVHCGECAACRAGDDRRCASSRLLGGNHPGGYAELCLVPATHVFPMPADISYAHAATIATACSTAWRGLVATGGLTIGESVVIHAAGSGVSTFAIQIAKHAGARVIATSRHRWKLDRAMALGADAVVDTATDDLADAVRAATGGRGADMVFDHVGPALFQPSLRSLRQGGRLVFCGTTTGPAATFDLAHAYHSGLSLVGVPSMSYADFVAMLDFYWSAGLAPVVADELPLADAPEAHRRVEADEVFGKIVLTS